jgi:hypothetical protein
MGLHKLSVTRVSKPTKSFSWNDVTKECAPRQPANKKKFDALLHQAMEDKNYSEYRNGICLVGISKGRLVFRIQSSDGNKYMDNEEVVLLSNYEAQRDASDKNIAARREAATADVVAGLALYFKRFVTEEVNPRTLQAEDAVLLGSLETAQSHLNTLLHMIDEFRNRETHNLRWLQRFTVKAAADHALQPEDLQVADILAGLGQIFAQCDGLRAHLIKRLAQLPAEAAEADREQDPTLERDLLQLHKEFAKLLGLVADCESLAIRFPKLQGDAVAQANQSMSKVGEEVMALTRQVAEAAGPMQKRLQKLAASNTARGSRAGTWLEQLRELIPEARRVPERLMACRESLEKTKEHWRDLAEELAGRLGALRQEVANIPLMVAMLEGREDKEAALELAHLQKKVAEYGQELDRVRDALGTLPDGGGKLAEARAEIAKNLAEEVESLRSHGPGATETAPPAEAGWAKTRPTRKGDDAGPAAAAGSARGQDKERKQRRALFERNASALAKVTELVLAAVRKAKDKTIKDPEFEAATQAANGWKRLYEAYLSSYNALQPPDSTDKQLQSLYVLLNKRLDACKDEIISHTRPAGRRS